MTLYATATDRIATAIAADGRTHKLVIRCRNSAQLALAMAQLSQDRHRWRYVSARSTAPQYGRHIRHRLIEYGQPI